MVELERYVMLFRKWLWLILISVAVAGASSYFATRMVPPTFRTSFTIMVGEDAANPNLTVDQIATSQRLANAYAGMVRRQPILEATVDSLNLQTTWQELQSRVLVSQAPNSQLFEVRIVDTDPKRVKAVADEVARQVIAASPTNMYMDQLQGRKEFLKQQLDTLEENIREAEAAVAQKQAVLKEEVSARAVLDRQDEIQGLMLNLAGWRSTYASLLSSYQGRAPNTLSVIEPAFVPGEPAGPDVRANVLMAVAVGLLLAIAAVLLIEYVSDTLGSVEDVSRVLSLPLLGAISQIKVSRDSAALITSRPPTDPVSETYRTLRMNVQFTHLGSVPVEPKDRTNGRSRRTAASDIQEGALTLLVTSPGVGDGKSLTSANLAVSFAQAGKRTVLVDADLRHPWLHQLLGVVNESGLTTLFIDDSTEQSDEAWWKLPR